MSNLLQANQAYVLSKTQVRYSSDYTKSTPTWQTLVQVPGTYGNELRDFHILSSGLFLLTDKGLAYAANPTINIPVPAITLTLNELLLRVSNAEEAIIFGNEDGSPITLNRLNGDGNADLVVSPF